MKTTKPTPPTIDPFDPDIDLETVVKTAAALTNATLHGVKKASAETDKAVRLFWYCLTNDGWRYLHDSPETRSAHPNGRLMIRERLQGKRVCTPVKDTQHATQELQKARTRAVLKRYSTRSTDEAGSLTAAIAAYIADRKAHNKLEAAENARVVLDEFRELLPTVKTVRGIAKEHLTQFCFKLRDSGLSDRTVSNKYNRLRSFLKFAEHDVKLSKDDRPKYDLKLPEAYEKAETEALLKHADDYMRVAISMGLQLGLREQELMHAEWSDVHKEDKTFRVRSKSAYNFKVKDSEERDVPIPSALLKLLDAWQHGRKGSTLILGIGRDHQRPNGHLLRWLQRVAKKAGVMGATLHDMRRTYMTTLLRSGAVDIRTAQAFAGHSDLASTMRYLKPASAAEMQSKIDSVF
jgi:integrase